MHCSHVSRCRILCAYGNEHSVSRTHDIFFSKLSGYSLFIEGFSRSHETAGFPNYDTAKLLVKQASLD